MSILTIVAPVFSLIALGFLAARKGLLGEAAWKGLTQFTFTFAMPALLFRTLAGAKPLQASPLLIWVAYFGTTFLVWAAALVATRLVLRRPAADAASIAMTSVYGNIVMLGIPLCLSVYGDAAVAPMAMILSVNTPLLWLCGTLMHVWLSRTGSISLGETARGLFLDLARNPLIVAIIAGGLWRTAALPIPGPVDATLAGQLPTLTLVLVLKLVAMPFIAALVCFGLALPPVVAGVLILFSAMPAGANSFLFASKVGRAVNSASGAAALGTLLSGATAFVLVAWLRQMHGTQ
jgi:predicted permease